ncbi:hypothetical protein COBT_000194 [Conglomerata obtusa]
MYEYIISTNKTCIPHIINNTDITSHLLCVYTDDLFFPHSYFATNQSLELSSYMNTNARIYMLFKEGVKLKTPKGCFKIEQKEYDLLVERCNPHSFELYCEKKKKKNKFKNVQPGEKLLNENKFNVPEKQLNESDNCCQKTLEKICVDNSTSINVLDTNESICNKYSERLNVHLMNNGDCVVEPKNSCEMIEALKIGCIITTNFINQMVEFGQTFRYDLGCIKISNDFECNECCKNLSIGYLEHLWKEKEINALYYISLHNYYQLNKLFISLNADSELIHEIQIID